MKFNDAVIGAGLIVFAAAMALYTRTFPAMPGQSYGPALFPVLIGIGLAVCGALLVARGLRKRAESPWFAWAPWARRRSATGGILLTIALLVGYILAAERAGFVVAAGIMLLALFLQGGVRWWAALATAAVTVAAIHQGFTRGLRVPLPRVAWLDWMR
jgi:putative tricarboxylic transport membrane protein